MINMIFVIKNKLIEFRLEWEIYFYFIPNFLHSCGTRTFSASWTENEVAYNKH